MRWLTGAILATAALAAPAGAATRDFPLAGFDKVQLDGAADIRIVTGSRFAIRADGDDDQVARLAPIVRDGTLFLDWPRDGDHESHGKVTIAITMPRVAGVGIKGAGRIDVDRAEAQTVVAAIEGAGDIAIAAIKAPRTVLALKGTGSITVSGTTDWLDARKSGVGSITATDLVARGGVLVASGIGRIAARIDGPVDATLSGIGSIDIAGRPVCTLHRSGLGHITCGG